ncbi:hypothetical protein AWZ03_014170, partial [Drosophila navojoa]
MYNKMLSISEDHGFRSLSHSDSTENDAVAAQDILTCGACQKTFALSDIVRFIQHKVMQCNKENYGQCTTQAPSMDRDADEGRPLSLVNRRPSISAPITGRKSAPVGVAPPTATAAAAAATAAAAAAAAAAAVASSAASGSRIHTPPPSPADLLADGASSTPKRLVDENDNTTPKADSEALPLPPHSPQSGEQDVHIGRAAIEDCALLDDKPKVKQEPLADDELPQEEQPLDEEQQQEQEQQQERERELEQPAGDDCQQPLAKRPKMELVDAEANTVHT